MSGFLGARLSAVRPGVPAPGRGALAALLRAASAEPELIPSPAAPARRVVTFRAAVPGTLSRRPRGSPL